MYGDNGIKHSNGSESAVSGRRAVKKPTELQALDSKALAKRQRELATEMRETEYNNRIVRIKTRPDRVLIILILVLLCLGTVTVYSASYPTSQAKFGNSYHYLINQLEYAGLGIAVMLAVAYFPGGGFSIKWLRRFTPFIYGIAVALLILVLFVGTTEGEAKRWLILGPVSVQPSEVMKFAMVLMLAWYIEKHRDKVIGRPNIKLGKAPFLKWLKLYGYRTGIPCLIVGVACVLVLLEKHLSGMVILGAIGASVIIIGGSHLGELLSTVGIFGPLAGGGFLLFNPYAMERIKTMLDGNSDTTGGAWQTTQGLYAIGSGGLLGLGFGCSRLKYSYIFGAHTDFIFSIWCEEMGFVGAVFLILLYLALIWRCILIAMKAPDTFSSLVVFGIAAHIAVQVLVNIAVVTALFPNTGVTLPFFSFGGSSTVILLGEMGVVLAISRHSYVRK